MFRKMGGGASGPVAQQHLSLAPLLGREVLICFSHSGIGGNPPPIIKHLLIYDSVLILLILLILLALFIVLHPFPVLMKSLHLHLSDTFIQSDLQSYSGYTFVYQ